MQSRDEVGVLSWATLGAQSKLQRSVCWSRRLWAECCGRDGPSLVMINGMSRTSALDRPGRCLGHRLHLRTDGRFQLYKIGDCIAGVYTLHPSTSNRAYDLRFMQLRASRTIRANAPPVLPSYRVDTPLRGPANVTHIRLMWESQMSSPRSAGSMAHPSHPSHKLPIPLPLLNLRLESSLDCTPTSAYRTAIISGTPLI